MRWQAQRPPSPCFSTCSPADNMGPSVVPQDLAPSLIFSLLQFERKVNCRYKCQRILMLLENRGDLHFIVPKTAHLRPAQLCLNHCQDPKSLFRLSCLYNTHAERKVSGLAQTQLLTRAMHIAL